MKKAAWHAERYGLFREWALGGAPLHSFCWDDRQFGHGAWDEDAAGSAFSGASIPGGQSRVLIAVREDRARRTVARALPPEGYAVVLADDGPSTLEQFEGHQFDLVILDDDLPKGDLAHLCRVIKGANLALILLHTDEDADGIARALEWGADDFVAFPVRRADLADRVENVLRKYRFYHAR